MWEGLGDPKVWLQMGPSQASGERQVFVQREARAPPHLQVLIFGVLENHLCFQQEEQGLKEDRTLFRTYKELG